MGCRGKATGRKLWEKIKNIDCDKYCTDYWDAYKDFIPSDKHVMSKKETYTIEGYNSLIRHYLARFNRKTKCYSKSDEMVICSIKLLINKQYYT
jgi:insertion element IS1 protein InsB